MEDHMANKLTYTEEVQYLRTEIKDLNKNVEDFVERYDEFVTRYDVDMRGDLKDEIGIIGNLRYVKKRMEEYPSILWLLAHKPISVITVGVSTWVVIMLLWSLGVLPLVGQLFGVDIPVVTPVPLPH